MDETTAPSLRRQIEELGPWFHNLHLPDGTQTAPGHFLGDFPTHKWNSLQHHLPESMEGWAVLDVGCNAGFYSFEFARRGANVTAFDYDEHYLRQARWAAGVFDLEEVIQFECKQVYDLARDDRTYDAVIFMGVLYHLRYPLLGLDILARKTRKLLVLQTMTCPGEAVLPVPADLALEERDQMLAPGWPTMAFIENRVANDPTNWWAPNHACVEAMVRSAGLSVRSRPAHEVYLCERRPGAEWERQDLLEAEFAAATGQQKVRS